MFDCIRTYEYEAYAIGARQQASKTYLEKNFDNFKNCNMSGEAMSTQSICTEIDSDANFSVEGTGGGTFSKKVLKQLTTVIPSRVVETSKAKLH